MYLEMRSIYHYESAFERTLKNAITHISRHFFTPPRVLLGLFALLKACIAAALTVEDNSSLERGGSGDFS